MNNDTNFTIDLLYVNYLIESLVWPVNFLVAAIIYSAIIRETPVKMIHLSNYMSEQLTFRLVPFFITSMLGSTYISLQM